MKIEKVKNWGDVRECASKLKRRFWEKYGQNYLTYENMKLLANELDDVMLKNYETPCHADIISIGRTAEVCLSSHYFKNREGVSFRMDAPDGIGFAGWASIHNYILVMAAFEKWLNLLEVEE